MCPAPKGSVSARERYEFAELIGEGGFGRTHAATRRGTGEPVLIKELLLRELSDWKPVEQFEREAKILGALSQLESRPMRPEQIAKAVVPVTAAAVAVAAVLPLIGVASLALFLPLLLCAGLPVAAVLRARRRARGLYARGAEVAGRVSSANSAQMGAFIEYEYEVEGTRHGGYAYTRDTLALAGLERGSPIRVFHDPDDPSVSVGLVSS